MVAYFKRYISSWMDGTEGLSDGEYRVYDVICNLIYLNDGPVVLNERGFAGRSNQHLLAFRRHFQALIAKTKLALTPDGKVTNGRAEGELRKIANRKPPTNPPSTPGRPPAYPPRTLAQPPPSNAPNPLKNGKVPISVMHLDKIRRDERESSQTPQLSLYSESNLPVRANSFARAFVEFWSVYPRKVDKGHAEKALKAALKLTDITTIVSSLRRQSWSDDKTKIPYPATWLNGKRWEDIDDVVDVAKPIPVPQPRPIRAKPQGEANHEFKA